MAAKSVQWCGLGIEPDAGGLLAGIGIIVLVGGARAADLPLKAPPPAEAGTYDWTGFYIGGHFGYAFGRGSN